VISRSRGSRRTGTEDDNKGDDEEEEEEEGILPHMSTLRLRDGPSYWEERFRNERSFDWYIGFTQLEPVFKVAHLVGTDDRILMIGCGNSPLSQNMYDAGYLRIVNMDVSPTVIQNMRRRHRSAVERCGRLGGGDDGDGGGLEEGLMSFHVGDSTSMPQYGDGTFDVVFDKGCLDALRCCHRSEGLVTAMLKEVYRVLPPGGIYLCVTSGSRTRWLKSPALGWDVGLIKINRTVEDGEEQEHQKKVFLYVCKKKRREGEGANQYTYSRGTGTYV